MHVVEIANGSSSNSDGRPSSNAIESPYSQDSRPCRIIARNNDGDTSKKISKKIDGATAIDIR